MLSAATRGRGRSYQAIPPDEEDGKASFELGEKEGEQQQQEQQQQEQEQQQQQQQQRQQQRQQQPQRQEELGLYSSADAEISPRFIARNAAPSSRTSPVSRWVTTGFASLWTSFAVLLLAVALALLAGFRFATDLQVQVGVLRDTVAALEAELGTLRINSKNNYNTLTDDITRIESNFTSHLSGTDGRLDVQGGKIDDVEKVLARLTNRTTNAEVLDQFKKTKQQLDTEMVQVRDNISWQLRQQTHNVTAKMEQNALRMQETESDIRDVVRRASTEIHAIQANVTDQLGTMKQSLDTTASELSDAVDSAQATIHTEVKLVQDNIEQYVAITNSHFAAEDDFVKYQLAGTFTLLGCLMSGYHLTGHLRHYYKPEVQRRVMAVLWMVPVYGITSWFSLVMNKFEAIFAALRDCYEAYAVYTFIALLIAIMEDGQGLSFLLQKLTLHVVEERKAVEEAVASRTRRPPEHLRPPFPCCYEWHKPSQVAKAWLYQCRLMALQFVVAKPFFSLVPFVMWLSGYNYDDQPPVVHGVINWASPRIYITFFSNASVGIAFYGLLSFYHGTEKDLAWCDPWPKFLCIKGVVFMTFWQGLVLQAMASAGFVLERQATQLQNLLICIEMLLASIAHFYIFPYYEWEEGYKREKEKSVLIRDTLALRDFVTDMKMMVSRVEWENVGQEEEEADWREQEGGGGGIEGGSGSGTEQAGEGRPSVQLFPVHTQSDPPSPSGTWVDSSSSQLLGSHGTGTYGAIPISSREGSSAGLGASGNGSGSGSVSVRESIGGHASTNAEVLALFGKAISQLSETVDLQQEREREKREREREQGRALDDGAGGEGAAGGRGESRSGKRGGSRGVATRSHSGETESTLLFERGAGLAMPARRALKAEDSEGHSSDRSEGQAAEEEIHEIFGSADELGLRLMVSLPSGGDLDSPHSEAAVLELVLSEVPSEENLSLSRAEGTWTDSDDSREVADV